MKRLQKIALSVLALTLLLCLLASCAVRLPNLSKSDGAEQEQSESPATQTVMRYGERTLDESDYAYLMAVIKEYYAYYCYYYYGQDLSDMWEEPTGDDQTFAEMLTENVNDLAKMMLVVEQLCAEAGLAVDGETLSEIRDYMQSMTDDYGGKAEMEAALADLGMRSDSVERYERYNALLALLRDHRYGKDGVSKLSREEVFSAFLAAYVKVEGYFYGYLVADGMGGYSHYQHDFGSDTVEQAMAFFKKNYVTVRHILYKDENKAKEVYDGILAGTTTFAEHETETVDSAVQYTFTYGTMVKPFEDAAFGMEAGAYELVQTDYGWHLVTRLELDEDAFELTDVTAAMSREALKEEAEKVYGSLKAGDADFKKPASDAPYTYSEPTLLKLSTQDATLQQALEAAVDGEIVFAELPGYGVYVLRKLAVAEEDLDSVYESVEEPLVQEAYYAYLEGFFKDLQIDSEVLGRFDIKTAKTLQD